jgi:transposase
MKQAKDNGKPRSAGEAKVEVLRRQGALHPRPEAVRDEAFRQGEFFDARDLVQVRYEMLRRHQVDGKPVTDVADSFGVSRQAFYTAEAAFQDMGILGILPRQRGPRRAHKCTEEILEFVERQASDVPGKDMAAMVRKRFGVSINPRSIRRALIRRKKNSTNVEGCRVMKDMTERIDWRQEYEDLRQGATRTVVSRRGHGLALFLSRGMMAWLEVLAALKSHTAAPTTTGESASATELTSAVRPDVTTLLANMVLCCMGEEKHECIAESHS